MTPININKYIYIYIVRRCSDLRFDTCAETKTENVKKKSRGHHIFSTSWAQFLGAFAKLWKLVIIFVMSVSSSALLSVRFPHGTTQFQQDRFLRNFTLEDFTKIYRENLSLFEMRQEQMVLYMTTNVYLWLCLAHFFSEWGIFHTNFVEKIKKHVSSSIKFCRNSRCFSDNTGKHGTAKQTTVDNIQGCW